ncbi:MAG: YdcF family protein [Treponema sp.]|jgi:uncharacterized SAM-binding protein YcdF (DUF218 family)|nr:YdcF family protein [Treponema sp.]
MIFLSKIATVFLLPPGCLILALLLLVIYIPRRYKIFPVFILLLFYTMSIQPVSDFLLKPLENAYPPLKDDVMSEWPQAIIILGGGTVQGSPEAGTGKDVLSSEAMKRALYAFTLRDRFPVPLVFTGGKVFEYNQEPEAIAAHRLYESLGLPAERFIPEDKSRNTWENARETAKLVISSPDAGDYQIKKAILVTSAYHIKRGVYCFESNGISVIPAPTDYKCHRGRKYDFFSYMPSMGYLGKTSLALHEYIGLLYYVIAYR